MGLFGKVVDFLTGGLGQKIVDKVLAQFPDKLTEKEKADIQTAILAASREHELKLLEIAQSQEFEFNERIKEMEGTASDLQQFGIVGRLLIFLRGAQRPIWGFGVLYLDFMIFSGRWKLAEVAKIAESSGMTTFNLESAFWMINFLVLGFLFGERAMRNVLPLFKNFQAGKSEAES